MYILKRYKDGEKDKKKNFYHEIVVPLIFVALWIAGLTFSIINPLLPLLDPNNTCSMLLSSLVYIYVIFIIEVIVTFTDIHNVYRLYNAKSLLIETSGKWILPNIALTIGAFAWYYHHQEIIWLIPFVLLSALIKFQEVWLANNGDVVFVMQQEKMDSDHIFKPKQML